MTRKRFALGLTVASSLLLPAAQAGAQNQSFREPVKPRYLTADEQAAYREEGTNAIGDYVWECDSRAAFTDPPPADSRFMTEAEQTTGVLLSWPSYGCDMSPLTELIRNAAGLIETTVFVPSTAVQTAAISCLRGRGLTDTQISQIQWFFPPLDYRAHPPAQGAAGISIWMRDFGPEMLQSADGRLQFVDMGYYSGASTEDCDNFGGRPDDDISPTAFASAIVGGIDTFRPPLRTEGGNLQTDGNGTCVHMTRDVLAANNFSRWQYSQADLDGVYTSYYNCNRVISLESMRGDPMGPATHPWTVIDHVDMFMTFISSNAVLVGQYDPIDDPVNAPILDRNAQRLSDAGYRVVRIPMPPKYCTLYTNSCIANRGASRMCNALPAVQLDRVWATYGNSTRLGNRMIVPVYRDVPAAIQTRVQAAEAQALMIFQRELDTEFGAGVVQVVAVPSDDMIPCQGSVHCITMTY